MHSRKAEWILAAQAVLFAVLLCIFFFAWNGTMRSVNVQFPEWTSEHAQWAEGWLIEKGNSVRLTSPFLSIPKGTYTLRATYSCESDENLTMTAPEGMHYFVHGGESSAESALAHCPDGFHH